SAPCWISFCVFSRILTRMTRGHPRSRAACMYFCQSSVPCIIINSHNSLSTSQLTRDLSMPLDSDHMCQRINMEPTLQPLTYGTKTPFQRFIYAARCALKGRKIYSIWPIHNIVFTIKYLKLQLARHICISHNTYRVILFTSLPYSIIRKNLVSNSTTTYKYS